MVYCGLYSILWYICEIYVVCLSGNMVKVYAVYNTYLSLVQYKVVEDYCFEKLHVKHILLSKYQTDSSKNIFSKCR